MSDIDLAVRRSKKIERILERNFDARGRGLHEKLSSVEARLPDDLVRKLRKIATIRNKIVHDESYHEMDDRTDFARTCDEAERQLKSTRGHKRSGRRTALLFFAALMAGMLVAFYYFTR